MPTVAEFAELLHRAAGLDRAAAWDPVGLQVGDPARPVERVAVCHEVSDTVIDDALASGADTLVAYHPLLFRPAPRLVAGPSASGRAYRLAAAGMSLLVVHTGFDAAPGGTADALASALGIGSVAGFGPDEAAERRKLVVFVPATHAAEVRSALTGAGAGTIGRYRGCGFEAPGTGHWAADPDASPTIGDAGEPGSAPEHRLEMVVDPAQLPAAIAALHGAHPYEEPAYDVYRVEGPHGLIGRIGDLPKPVELGEFAATVAERLASPALRKTADRPVRRVAVVPGSGSEFADAARAAGADLLVTGDVPHHRALAALERGMGMIDAGHAPTERPGMTALVGLIGTMAGDVVDLTGVRTDPWVR